MKKQFQLAIGPCLFVLAVLSAKAAFSSLYVFGDGLSSTTGNPDTVNYYTHRYSNGRVWVEVLAQRQGLTYVAGKNISDFDNNSSDVVTEVNGFSPPVDVTNGLFIVWVCNADTFDAAQVPDNSSQWDSAINQSQANHLQIITNLYAKGVRTLVLPNAVDISKIPAYNGASSAALMRQKCVSYNVAFSNSINQARALCPGIKIYTPDMFSFFNKVLTNASFYGLTNALYDGVSVDALDDLYGQSPTVLNGPGTNYIFWDPQEPTAKVHEVIADIVQQLISPVQVGQVAAFSGSNRLDIVNYPAGLNGFVDGLTNLVLTNWSAVVSIASTNTTQSAFVPTSGPQQFYRLRFPYSWSWP